MENASKNLNLGNNIFVGTRGDKRCIEFDIAVSVKNKDDDGGSASIKVLEFISFQGGLNREVENSTVSRIKFGVLTPNIKELKNLKLSH